MDVFSALTPISLAAKGIGLAAVLSAAAATMALLYGMGSALCPRRLPGHAERFGLGFLCLGTAMAILGAIGALRLALVVPLFSLLAVWGYARRPPFPFKLPRLGVLGGLAVTLIVLRCLTALLPQTHGDPQYYHLPSAWAWARTGRIYFINWLPFALQGGIGEYLYTFLATLLPDRMAVQIAAQLLHALWGFGLTGLVVHRIARHWLPDSWAWVAALAFLTFSAQSGLLVTAKNDGYVMALAMLSLLQVSEQFQKEDRARDFLAYAFAFGAFAVKHTAIFYLAPFLMLFWLFQVCEAPKQWRATIVRHAGFALLTCPLALPALLRNYAFTGNPMFPAMDEIFRSPFMNDRLRTYMQGFSRYPGSTASMLGAQVQRLWGSKLFYVFSLGAWRTKVPMVRFLGATLALSVGVLILMTGRGEYARFHYYLYAVLSLLAATGAHAVWERWAQGARRRRAFAILFGVSILLGSAVEVSVQQVTGHLLPWLASSESYVTYFARLKPLFAIQQWMNAHLVDAKIFSFAENEVYYLNHPQLVPENHREANDILAAPTFETAQALLKEGGYTHILVPPGREQYFPVLTEDPRFTSIFRLLREDAGYRLYGWMAN